ncbi:MAG: radical SAM family heme chaperone HemW [Deltaproteobacteria bacterium]|nr:radical SAM family heme chaperone HemW [Deltaproteobacteria bacterium]
MGYDPVGPDLKWDQPGHAGIYIHIPFCIKKCSYCDFYSVTDLTLKKPFVDALETEIRLTSTHQPPCDTLYLGGGTPSVLETDQICFILESCFKYFNLLPDAEITMEVNPGTVNKAALKEFRLAGVNRLSIGIQSFQNQGLNFLGRIHSSDDASDTVRAAVHAGFENISIDLIYGIPDTTLTYWKSDLEKAIQFQPEHLSCYMLSFEPGTPLFDDLQAGLIRHLSEKDYCILFETTRQMLGDSGYIQYEISNFARSPTLCSRHNMKYWTFMPYIGLGPSAHSFNNNQRKWNKKSIPEYLEDLGKGLPATEKKETLTTEQQMIEALYLGFRQTAGIDTSWFNKTFDRDFNQMFADAINTFSQKRYMNISENKCRLTTKGLLLLDSIVDAFVAAI